MRRGALAGSATLAGVLAATLLLSMELAGCAPPRPVDAEPPARSEPKPSTTGATTSSPPSAAPPAVPAEPPPGGPFTDAVFAALEGICERAWSTDERGLHLGCKQCPRAEPGHTASGSPTAIAHAEPALVVTRIFAGKLLGPGSDAVVVAYDGCMPGIYGYGGTLLVDRATRRVVRDEAGLALFACQAAAHDGREVLVCRARRDGYKMTVGSEAHFVGVYDPIDLRPVNADDATDIAAWHAIPLFTTDAAYYCAAGGTPPGTLVRHTGAGGGLRVEPPKVVVSGTFAKRVPTPAYRKACEADADLADVLRPEPFELAFRLERGRLVATPAAASWIARAR